MELVLSSQTEITDNPHFIVLHRYCIFDKLNVCGNPMPAQMMASIFSNELFFN